MFRDLLNNIDPPSTSTEDQYLLGTQDTLEHIKLHQSVQTLTQSKCHRRNNGSRLNRSLPANDAINNPTKPIQDIVPPNNSYPDESKNSNQSSSHITNNSKPDFWTGQNQLYMDSASAIAYIQEFGGTKSSLLTTLHYKSGPIASVTQYSYRRCTCSQS